MDIIERFINYVKFDTMSSEESETSPSSASQMKFAEILKNELISLNVDKVILTKEGLVYAYINGNPQKKKIGLIAHMDTAPDMIGGNYEPKIITSYQGGDIPLNDTYTLSEKEFPSLKKHHNDTLIVTDGNHLLGGDDKAGITIIMEVIKYFTSHKEIDHAPIRICFTPDEEVGRGSEHFDVKVMDADFAYTLDGGTFNDINYENFNAFSARVMIKGINIHPGSAKDIMINSILIGQEFNALLPQDEIPSKTSDYQGFYHLCDIKGSVEETTLDYIIRDHDYQKALEKVNKMKEITSFLQNKYPKAIISLNIKESYHNMKEYFIKDMSAIDKITNVFKKHQIKPTFTPIRGGTDGASITFMGLPCPNLGTGDYNCHGRYEYVSVNEMKQMVEIIKDLLID